MSDCKSCRFLRDTGRQWAYWSTAKDGYSGAVDGDGQHPGKGRVDHNRRYECRIRAPGWVHEDGGPASMYVSPPDLLGCGEWQAKTDGAAIPEGYQVLERGDGDWIALGPEKHCVAAEKRGDVRKAYKEAVNAFLAYDGPAFPNGYAFNALRRRISDLAKKATMMAAQE